MNVTVPTDRPVYEGNMATYWFDNGILVSKSKSILRTVESIGDNVAFVKKITNNEPMPLLIYLAPSPVPDKTTRKFSTEKIPEIYTAMAMVSKPGLSKFIMNLLFGLKKPPVPMKSFSDDVAAREWLKQFVKES
jgi:hypothetical protein